MRKIISYGGIAIVCFLFLYAPFYRKDVLPDLDVIAQNMEAITQAEELMMQDAKFIRRYYGVSQEQYETAMVYRKHAAMDVSEIAIFQADEEAQIQQLKQACQQRIDQQIERFQGYGEVQVGQLQRALVIQDRTIVVLIIHEDPDTIKESLSQSLQEDSDL